jgi:hypothetical protein
MSSLAEKAMLRDDDAEAPAIAPGDADRDDDATRTALLDRCVEVGTDLDADEDVGYCPTADLDGIAADGLQALSAARASADAELATLGAEDGFLDAAVAADLAATVPFAEADAARADETGTHAYTKSVARYSHRCLNIACVCRGPRKLGLLYRIIYCVSSILLGAASQIWGTSLSDLYARGILAIPGCGDITIVRQA